MTVTSSGSPSTVTRPGTGAVARVVLISFLLTFVLARVLVLMIMLRWVPTLYLHVHGAHVHHLNYGIFLLAIVGGVALLARPGGPALGALACVYGVGLALTFDEFGMWVHLGGPYWQRASFDAVVAVASVLGLIAFAPSPRSFTARQWAGAAVVAVALGLMGVVLARSMSFARERISPILHQIEERAPT